ncbi:bifunctional metallophosphatase/5'-nucleotidase [Paenibacillus odorifer]|uniref:Bifunctional metallophosphatase/5'-nucleotidase n=1 Tax=Paenibacillus odorifer TaxID=189426 RepID=A0A1R0WT69_9BACL|nr:MULTISPECIES: bifunctional metallophosphatase/5'-nucleotidase [Paenibacillus]ETT67881.1 2',3'-cyclic-nucleotide 2'-phosphodiesterase [Paenibacillus sp. FSL H8-237]OMD20703.1 bifunctional metallophosphatase/5'-nucleotidase [Paenibacillus odorifer]OME53513.1 bifunctional metallophosphatase/5'-nucleotidase [Paenibacillus odorifer]
MNKENSITCEILVTSDLHGHFGPVDYRTGEKRPAGLATIATLIKQERSHTPELILIDNGDLIQGTPLTYYAATHYSNELNPGIAALNELNYDAAIIGNHEFNFGKTLLNKAVQDSRFPWLSAGIIDNTTNQPAFGKPYIIKWVDKIKVAVLGVTTHYIPHWENPSHIEGLQFEDSLETVKHWCAIIRAEEQPDLLVVAYHGGFERDLSSGEPVERLTGENQAYAMCTEVEGIDVLITGHQHRSIAGELNGVTIIQPGCNGLSLGKISVIFQKENTHWKIQRKHAELLTVNETTAADDVILELNSTLESETQTWLDERIGTVIGDLSISSADECRLADHPFIEFMNKVQMEAAGVDISTAALLSNDCKGFSETITRRDILSNFIYPNTLTVLRLTGQDIREALEQTANYFQQVENGIIAVNPAYIEPKPQHYNYDMWEGIQYELDTARPAGERVLHLLYRGQPIEDSKEYEVVMNNYRASGGGDYEMYKGKPIVQEIMIDISEIVTDYIEKHGQIEATCDHNWRVV